MSELTSSISNQIYGVISMKIIAFLGGSSLCELGPAADVQLFFDCVQEFVVHKVPEPDWPILTDRLYRKYLCMDELARAEILMDQVKHVFANVPISEIDLSGITEPTPKTWLDPKNATLAELFSKYFENFTHCKDSTKMNYETFKSYPGYQYEPVRIVISNMPEFMTDKKRSLEEYEAIDGEPFWTRGNSVYSF
ncbi:MAG: hypothetical protein WA071_26610 [Undibacterium umbellatum]|uniref:hypothetical protein n=1 Tax=Undibacterium umbellatum TaxID=2762300 RepID=UPI003BB6D63E